MKKRILIIDDEKDIAVLLEDFLRSMEFEVNSLHSLEKWDDIFSFGRPDLIFLDYRMQPITGKELLEKLQFEPEPIPIIMMSAYKSNSGIFEVKKLGAYAYIGKPFDFDEIEDLVKTVLHS